MVFRQKEKRTDTIKQRPKRVSVITALKKYKLWQLQQLLTTTVAGEGGWSNRRIGEGKRGVGRKRERDNKAITSERKGLWLYRNIFGSV